MSFKIYRFYWCFTGKIRCVLAKVLKSKRKFYLVKELYANSFRVSLVVLKGYVLALWHKIQNRDETLNKQGWAGQSGDLEHWCKEQWAGPQGGLAFACFNSHPSPDLRRKLICQHFPYWCRIVFGRWWKFDLKTQFIFVCFSVFVGYERMLLNMENCKWATYLQSVVYWRWRTMSELPDIIPQVGSCSAVCWCVCFNQM